MGRTIAKKRRIQQHKSMDFETQVLPEDDKMISDEVENLKVKYKLKKRGQTAFYDAMQIKASMGDLHLSGKILQFLNGLF